MSLATLSRRLAAKFSPKFAQKPVPAPAARKAPPAPKHPPAHVEDEFEAADPITISTDPLHQCAELGRYAHLLTDRQRWMNHPDLEKVCQDARAKIDEMFAIVPDGFVSLPQVASDEPGCPEIMVETKSYLLARHAVTNAQFQKFVDAGGYEQLTLWPEEIWPHLIDFKDQTNNPAPRFWREGRHNKKLADHPVVGLCQYEAMAYALWAGYRLPTEAEWQMAATWRIRSQANVLRRYPWGDALDVKRCNIWATGVGQTVPIHKYPNGGAPNHVLQLIGNVWEWTDDEFLINNIEGDPIVGDMRMAPIRGGAFDTYFSAQATGTFRTGLACLSRMHNVGFRCARDLNESNG